ncbi:MAG TPA: hypothetical protein VFA53_06160 [Xanthobacteraceae bacterium]|nr:hypothetical protein [Xanthobacteraceae bacterium]
MWKAALAGAVALATIGSALTYSASEAAAGQAHAAGTSGVLVTSAQIARLKSQLKLTPMQEPLWPAVEEAFRELGHPQLASAAPGVAHGLGAGAASVALDAAALHHLFAAAYPLLRTLDAEQKQSALTFARSIGLEAVVAAF